MTYKFTTEQMEALAPFEGRMVTATRSHWCSAVSQRELEKVVGILNAATGLERRPNANCASCILEAFTDAGRIYFATKAAMAAKITKENTEAATKVKPADIAGKAVKAKKTTKKKA